MIPKKNKTFTKATKKKWSKPEILELDIKTGITNVPESDSGLLEPS